MKILGRNFPFFSKAVKWVCRASQVIGDDGKSIEDKLEEIGIKLAAEESAAEGSGGGSGNAGKLLTLTLHGEGDVYENSPNLYYDFVDPPSEDDEGQTTKGGNTKGGDTKSGSNYVLKSEVDAILNAGVYSQVVILNDDTFMGVGITNSIVNTDNEPEEIRIGGYRLVDDNGYQVIPLYITIFLLDNFLMVYVPEQE